MPKTVKCPNCGCEFEEGLKDKGYSYAEVKAQVEGLLEGGQTVNPELVSKQYGKPHFEVTDMIKKIRKKRPDKILRPVRQGQFKFLEELEDIANSADKRQRNIWGQHKVLAQDRLRQVALLEKTKDPEMLRQAAEIRNRFYITGDLLDEPQRAKRLPSGLFQVTSGDVAEVKLVSKPIKIETREDALDFLIKSALQPKWIESEQRVQYAVYPVKKGIAVPITPQYKRKTEELLTKALNINCKREVDEIRKMVTAELKAQGRI